MLSVAKVEYSRCDLAADHQDLILSEIVIQVKNAYA
jgi:hypothetical protein